MYATRPRRTALTRPLALSILLTVALAGLGACGRTLANVPAGAPDPTATPPSFLPTPPAFPPGPTVYVTVSGYLAHGYLGPQDLCVGDVVAVGVIAQYGSAHWNSPDGNRSSVPGFPNATADGYEVVTPMAFSQWQVLSDRRVGPTREYAARGGHAGNVYSEDGPKPPVDQRYVLVFTASLVGGSGSQWTDRLMELVAAMPVNRQNDVYFPYSRASVPLTVLAGDLAHCLGNHAATPTG